MASTLYAEKAQSIRKLFNLAIIRWWQGLLMLAPFIPWIFVTSIAYDYMTYRQLNQGVMLGVQLVAILLDLFLSLAAMHLLDQHWQGKPKSLKLALKVAMQKLPQVVGVLVLYLLIGLLIYEIVLLLFSLLRNFFAIHSLLAFRISLVIAGFIYLFFAVLFYLTIPLVLLENNTVLKAFSNSARYTIHCWLHVFMVYLASTVFYYLILEPHLFIQTFSINSLWHLLTKALIGVLLLPIIINLFLFTFHEAKIRFSSQHST